MRRLTLVPLCRSARAHLLPLVLALALASCGTDTQTVEPTPALPVLTVVKGSGSGSYSPGQLVHVWADPTKDGATPAATVFERWQGDVAVLTDPTMTQASFVMPSASMTLTATYEAAALWTAERMVARGLVVNSYFPPNHRGVLFHFHGTGGSSDNLVTKVESVIFLRYAVAAGYAVVVPESSDRTNKQWQVSVDWSTNPDYVNISDLVAYFKNQGKIGATEPLVGVGTSNGGGFVPYIADLLGFKASVSFIAPGNVHRLMQSTVPWMGVLQQNDDVLAAGWLEDAEATQKDCIDRGVATELYVNEPSPLYPERFWRLGTLSPTDSQAIFQSLKGGGFLDANDFLIESPKVSSWAAVIPAAYSAPDLMKDIGDQLECSHATHIFSSDYDAKVIQFFDRFVP
ncbi:MAG: hypothetical protein HY903_00535 [Deltaproteobacteria bacterium]|nr:hypothetical protein [Deltaproteobacteria bacterium]